jgi:hypothetical protein
MLKSVPLLIILFQERRRDVRKEEAAIMAQDGEGKRGELHPCQTAGRK